MYVLVTYVGYIDREIPIEDFNSPAYLLGTLTGIIVTSELISQIIFKIGKY